jgi:hypothetical protein
VTLNGDEEQLRFETVKQDRGWYFVEYLPPNPGVRFATLSLTIPGEPRPPEDIAKAMEAELIIWLKKYPIPVMVSAFDASGSLLYLDGARPCSHLTGFLHPETFDIVRDWRLHRDEELPKDALDKSYLEEIYADIPSRTKSEIREKVAEDAAKFRIGWWVVFLWAGIVPAIIAILNWWSDWLGVVALCYSLGQALKKALQILGKWPKSKAEIEKAEEELRMRHHHYHCKRNPEGFLRLRAENFERWAREEIQKEAESLKPKRS